MSQEKTIAITRSKDDSEEFIELISKHQAVPITLPTIELVSKGEKIVDERVNIWSDPLHPDVPASTWSGDGLPRKKTQWIAHSEDMVMPKLSMIFCIVVLCIMHKLSKNDSIFM